MGIFRNTVEKMLHNLQIRFGGSSGGGRICPQTQTFRARRLDGFAEIFTWRISAEAGEAIFCRASLNMALKIWLAKK
jgi:hypothetical protein